MNSTINIVTKFSILLSGILMPMLLQAGGPGPPPPPDPSSIPFDLACGIILAGGAMVAGKNIYLKKEVA